MLLKTSRGVRDGLAPRRWRRGLRERLAPRRWGVPRSDLVPGEWPARLGAPIQAGKWTRDGAVALVLGCPKGIDSRDADLDGRGRSSATLSAASPFVIASKAAASWGVPEGAAREGIPRCLRASSMLVRISVMFRSCGTDALSRHLR